MSRPIKLSLGTTMVMALLFRDTFLATASRFSIIGVAATILYLTVASGLILSTSIAPPTASILAYIVGMILSFLGQSRFTFRADRNTWGQFARFSLLSACGLLVSYFSVQFSDQVFGQPLLGAATTALAIPALSFFIMRLWVFRQVS